ncbi:hypothetical protein OEZ86_002422 [Tetradesmus obliquus]|nr:hypothetical protein OEZ86_002422 [Tetradesmus obliquus]
MGPWARGVGPAAAAAAAAAGHGPSGPGSLSDGSPASGSSSGSEMSGQSEDESAGEVAVGHHQGVPQAGRLKRKAAKQGVAVPQFKRSQSNADESQNRLAQLPRRRTGDSIMAGMQAEADKAWRAPAPMPSGRLIDEQEKQRCALLMQYRGSIPCSHLAGTSAGCRQQQPHSSSNSRSTSSSSNSASGRRQLLHARFTELADEVAEREEFVSSMQQLGKLSMEHMAVVRGEVAAKVQEMRQLDEQIKQLDTQVKPAS